MPRYSPELKEKIIKDMLPPNNVPVKEHTNKRPESEERLPSSKLYENLLLELSVDCCKLGVGRTSQV